MKYLKINLTKEFKDLYNENFKTLKKDIRRQKKPGRINIVKITILPKTIYNFNVIPIKELEK